MKTQDRISITDSGNYNGDWKNGKMHGLGIMTWPDGRRYEGRFRYNVRHGHGVCTFYDGRIYDGNWMWDKQWGKGVFTWPNGARFTGCFGVIKFLAGEPMSILRGSVIRVFG